MFKNITSQFYIINLYFYIICLKFMHIRHRYFFH